MLDRGKVVVLVIFLCALVMGSFAWWYRYQQGHRCRQLWGSNAAQLIRQAPTVFLLTLAPASEAASDADPAALEIARRVEISGAPGLLHARHALLQDVNYQWHKAAEADKTAWRFVLEFQAGSERAQVWFSPANQLLAPSPEKTGALLNPALAQAFVDRLPEWLQYGEAQQR